MEQSNKCINFNDLSTINRIDSESDSYSIKSDDDKFISKKDYDPILDFKREKGILETEHIKRYNTHYVIINSSARRDEPIVKFDNFFPTIKDPLKINSNVLTLDVGKDHNLNVGDKINILGLKYVKKIIRTYTTYTKNNTDGTTELIKKYALDIVPSLDDNKLIFMRFDVDINIDSDNINTLASTGFNSTAAFFLNDDTNLLKDKEYDLSYSDLYVDINGFTVDNNSSLLNNIPINLLNSRHKVYFAPRLVSKSNNPVEIGKRVTGITDTTVHPNSSGIKSFYIKLPNEFKGDLSDIGSYNVNIVFRHYGGIPVNQLNAFYPITPDNITGFHTISNVYKTKVDVKLPRAGYYDKQFGGNGIQIAKIKEINTGFANSNSYTIDLSKTFNNIVQTRLISSEFPNYDKVFKDEKSIGIVNNKLYWQNLDNDTVYSISVPTGNYTASDLKTLLEKLFYDTLKKFHDESSIFTKNNFIRVTIDINTDLVTFSSFKESIINNPISKISPEISESSGLSVGDKSNNTYTLTINHPNHGLVKGDKILISNMLTTLGISSSILNTEHIINNIVTESSYTIVLNNINLEQIRSNTHGGNGIRIYIPNLFRMRFDFPGTMGKQLGFRRAGDKLSITPYQTLISNDTKYVNEISLDKSGNEIVIKKNSLQLSGANYILITCKELNGVINTGTIKNAFGKINLSGIPGTVLYNTYVPIVNYYHKPLKKITELSFEFYTPDGYLVDFDGLDHSFTLEIVTLDKLPLGTNISSNLG
jgi:hypothetical protein